MESNKTVLITGASSGMGAAIAQQLAKENYNLILMARQQDKLNKVADICKQYGNKILTFAADLQDRNSFVENWQKASENLGNVHHIILNHGIGYFSPFEEDKHWEETIDINLKSHMFITQVILPHLLKYAEINKPLTLIYIASTLAKQVASNVAAYCASKYGLLGFAESIYEEVRHKGIRVSVVCPGYVNTPMVQSHGVDVNKMMQPDDIAGLIAYILQAPSTMCPFEITIRPQYIE